MKSIDPNLSRSGARQVGWGGRAQAQGQPDLFPRVAREARSRMTGGSSSMAAAAAADWIRVGGLCLCEV